MPHPRVRQLQGFTLVELVVVITVLGILAAIAIVGFQHVTKDATRNAAEANLTSFARLITTEHSRVGAPELTREITLQALSSSLNSVQDGLNATGNWTLLGKDQAPETADEIAIGFISEYGQVNNTNGPYAVLMMRGGEEVRAVGIKYGGVEELDVSPTYALGTTPTDVRAAASSFPMKCPAMGEKNPLIVPRPTYHDTVLPEIDPETDPVTVFTVKAEAGRPNTFQFGTFSYEQFNITHIDWGGEGTASPTNPLSFTYNKTGTYQVVIHGNYDRLITIPAGVVSVDRWDEGTGVKDLTGTFGGAQHLVTVVAPPSTVTNYSYTFNAAELFNADVTGWDVSNATGMRSMFAGAKSFEGKGLETWDVSAVGTYDPWNFAEMFFGATKVNADLTFWDVSNAVIFRDMFYGATSFNGDTYCWRPGANTGRAVVRFVMFTGATAYEGKGVRNWDLSAIRLVNTGGMFMNTSFREDLSNWDLDRDLPDNMVRSMFETMPEAWKARPELHPKGLTYP